MNSSQALSSQSLISIHQIRKGVIILRNGSLRSILEVDGVNLDLKSTDEQNSILTNWRNTLNRLDFSLETIIYSRKINIAPYLNSVQDRINKEQNKLLQLQGNDYYNFLQGLTAENNIMEKKFYVVVPYNPIVTQATSIVANLVNSFKELLNLSHQAFTKEADLSSEEFNNYQGQLLIRQDNIITNLTRMGLIAHPLSTRELIELFYTLYNPGSKLEGNPFSSRNQFNNL